MPTLSLPTQNTRATLLLCAKLGERHDLVKPLTGRQYWAIVKWLHARTLRVEDLLNSGGRKELSELQIKEVAPDQVERLLDRGAALGLVLERWIGSGIWVVSPEDETYPNRYNSYLRNSAPPLLYGIGESATLQRGGLAIVGSRRASEGDLDFARQVGSACAEQSIAVISGAAKGVDSEAMTAALQSGGMAVGVLAEGFQRSVLAGPCYNAILNGNLTLVSAFEPNSPWFTYTAMERNKFIYALADAALVVACSEEQGGTWHGAVEALKRGDRRIYVNVSGDMSTAKRKLLDLGGRAFPTEPWSELSRLLACPEKKAHLFDPDNANRSATDPVEAEPQVSASSLFADPLQKVVSNSAEVASYVDFVARLLPLLEVPMNTAAISAELKLPKTQTRDWLKQALEDQRIHKVKRRYARVNTFPLFASEPVRD